MNYYKYRLHKLLFFLKFYIMSKNLKYIYTEIAQSGLLLKPNKCNACLVKTVLKEKE